MAFDANGLGIHVSSTGRGGFLTYYSDVDGKGTGAGNIGHADYWKTDLSGADQAANLRARSAAEDFVAQQAANPGDAFRGGVIMYVIGNDTTQAGATYRVKVIESGGDAGRLLPITF